MQRFKFAEINGIVLSASEDISPETYEYYDKQNIVISKDDGFIVMETKPGMMSSSDIFEDMDFAVGKRRRALMRENSPKIDAIFKEAIASCNQNSEVDSEHKKKFIMSLKVLHENTLTGFRTGQGLFAFDKSMALAQSSLTLAKKVGTNSVTKEDCKKFDDETKQFRASKLLATVLSTIIGAAVGMVVGAAIGFAVAGIPGVIGGAILGLVAGGIAASSATIWHKKKSDPQLQMVDSAIALSKSHGQKN